ncbi:MAG TPA: Lrp/AsnC family transcriptional regulator [Pseudolabrys sp.]|jgi:Lrp/AsnC family leucine-responsive transcriptional regulator|nr:Lrp/AsnC family transcriptional regulator [Pseudolabrys sp.]
MNRLDEIDRKLIMLLQRDGQLSLAELSRQTGVAASTINDRKRRLVEEGIVSGYHARIAPEALGLNLLAFVFVSWSNPKVESALIRQVKASPAVLECHHVTGAWNYLLKVRVGTTRDLERFLAEVVKTVSGVERTETVIVLSTVKEIWALDVSK